MTRCFFLRQTERAVAYLRRYASGSNCPLPWGYHDSHFKYIGEEPLVRTPDGSIASRPLPPWEDPRWPTHCECGYEFDPRDAWQSGQDIIVERSDTGESLPMRQATEIPGAMWYADWMLPHFAGPDGHCLTVMTPGGQWMIDSRASNCTMKEDSVHRCWVRHGTVPNITADKNGVTCAAGAGSIQVGNYHGFLQNGVFT